jgi:hypothetical protein
MVTHSFTAYERPPHTVLRFIDRKALRDWYAIHFKFESHASGTDEVDRSWSDVSWDLAMGSSERDGKKFRVTL